jgi:hypothetical protein
MYRKDYLQLSSQWITVRVFYTGTIHQNSLTTSYTLVSITTETILHRMYVSNNL